MDDVWDASESYVFILLLVVVVVVVVTPGEERGWIYRPSRGRGKGLVFFLLSRCCLGVL